MVPKQVDDSLRRVFRQLFMLWNIVARAELFDRIGSDGKRKVVYGFSGLNVADVEVLRDKRVLLEMLILSALNDSDRDRLSVEILGRY